MKKQIVSMKRGAQKGFTLIELMIVIAIIGILAAFAVPMFQDYTIRTRVGEGLVLASSAKNLVVDNAINGFDLNKGWTSPTSTVNTDNIAVNSGTGVITITSTSKANSIVLTLTPKADGGAALVAGTVPTGRIAWECKQTSSEPESQIPSECRS